MYGLEDLQGAQMREGVIYKSKKAIVKDLSSFHDQDFTGTDSKDKELSISDYFKFWKINTIQKQLDWLLDYGSWGLIEIKKRGGER